MMIDIEQYILSLDLGKGRLRGDEYIAQCPFHDDRHPSFAINVTTGKWNCLADSCMLAGDLARFIHLYEDRSWAEVYKFLGGTDVPASVLEIEALLEGRKNVITYQQYSEYHEPWFLKPVDEKILKNFTDLTVKDVEKFGIKQIVGGNWKGCLYCPIWDLDGNIISYTLKLSKKHGGRWWHPPDSSNKSILYGSNFVIGIRDLWWLIVIEGVWDKIKLNKFGWDNGVSIQGTKIRDQQLLEIKALCRLCGNPKVLVMFDKGTDGAMDKAVADLWSVGVQAYKFGYGEIEADDPGEFQESDIKELEKFIEKIEQNA